jgi:hypothetical protein
MSLGPPRVFRIDDANPDRIFTGVAPAGTAEDVVGWTLTEFRFGECSLEVTGATWTGRESFFPDFDPEQHGNCPVGELPVTEPGYGLGGYSDGTY